MIRCLICGAEHAACPGKVPLVGIPIDLPRRMKMANKNEYTADRDLFLDKDGNLVEANDPKKLTKLVGVGGTLSGEDALKYGLVSAEGGEQERTGGKAKSSLSTKMIGDERTAPKEEATDDLESLNVTDLKERAKEMGLKGYSQMNKAELIEAIEAGPQEEEGE